MSDVDATATAAEADCRATQMPVPSGFRILCMVPKVDEKYGSGLVKSDETLRVEEQTTVVLFVVKLGPLAYADTTRFPTGPWCKAGDFVLVRPYTGTRMIIHGREFRIINDDTVEGVVEDPRGLSRA